MNTNRRPTTGLHRDNLAAAVRQPVSRFERRRARAIAHNARVNLALATVAAITAGDLDLTQRRQSFLAATLTSMLPRPLTQRAAELLDTPARPCNREGRPKYT